MNNKRTLHKEQCPLLFVKAVQAVEVHLQKPVFHVLSDMLLPRL
mgnify:CR=1 FL=1